MDKNYKFYVEDDDFDNVELLEDKNVYGAIWTEWGLKYVSKMNEKGELELI